MRQCILTHGCRLCRADRDLRRTSAHKACKLRVLRCRRKRTRRAEAYIEIFPVRTSTRCNFHQRPDRYQLLQPEARDPTLTVVVYILPEPALQNFPALSLLPAPLLSSPLHCFLSRLSPINNTHTSLQAPKRCLNQSQQQSRFMILRRSSPMGRHSTLRI